ncbi:hypothetical protein, partial [Cronobacter sakazakii]
MAAGMAGEPVQAARATLSRLGSCLGCSQPGGKQAMMGRFFSRRAALTAAFLLTLEAAAPAAHAADVKVMSTVALTPTLGELI